MYSSSKPLTPSHANPASAQLPHNLVSKLSISTSTSIPIPQLRNHIIIILLLTIHNHNLLPLPHRLPIQRTRPLQPQPRPHTLEIKPMLRMTRQLHHKRVLIIPKPLPTNRTTPLPKLLPVDPLQRIQERLTHPLHLRRRAVGALFQLADQGGEQLRWGAGGGRPDLVVGVGEEGEGRAHVDGGGLCVWVVVGGGGVEADLGELREEGGHVGAAGGGGGAGAGGLDVVFHWRGVSGVVRGEGEGRGGEGKDLRRMPWWRLGGCRCWDAFGILFGMEIGRSLGLGGRLGWRGYRVGVVWCV